MPLNLEGIQQLKADLRANARHYNQANFAQVTSECGTEMCMAGLCLFRKIGEVAFNSKAAASKADYDGDESDPYYNPSYSFSEFVEECIAAGAEKLGLTLLDNEEYRNWFSDHDLGCSNLPPIFAESSDWPEHLREPYNEAFYSHDHQAMAEVACRALSEIDENGCFLKV